MIKKYKYRIYIEWSEQDDCFLVALPDFPGQKYRAHGYSYLDAVLNAQDVISALVHSYNRSEQLPIPKLAEY